MKAISLHRWDMAPEEARELQRILSRRISRCNKVASPQFIGGVDVGYEPETGRATAAVVVLDYPGLKCVETQTHHDRPSFPYRTGLLSFREIPVILAASEKLRRTPDLLFVDGQGVAHPRRFGLASHLGLLLDVPTIGCAKSRLTGKHDALAGERGAWTELLVDTEVIGAVVRTKSGVKPVYVSIGHKVDLDAAVEWTMKCCTSYRIPEPSRLAHNVAARYEMRRKKWNSISNNSKP